MRQLPVSIVCLTLSVSALCYAGTSAGDAGLQTPSAVVHHHTDAAGAGTFALTLRAPTETHGIADHLILVDTSASQTGRYRIAALSALESLLAALPRTDRVHLVAMDTQVASLTDGLVACGSEQLSAAFETLKARTPLGASDVAQGIQAALTVVDGSRPASLLYIGDGISASNLMSAGDVRELVQNLRARNVSLHALLMGPKLDTELSGLLVNHTGGTLVTPDHLGDVSAIRDLARSITEAPVFVTGLRIEGSAAELATLPEVAVRSDRHTIVFGQGVLKGAIQVRGTSTAGQELTWTARSENFVAAGDEIRLLQERAVATQGLNNALVDAGMLTVAAADLKHNVRNSTELANQLHRQGLHREAGAVARRAHELAPGDVQLTSLLKTITSSDALSILDEQQSADDSLGAASAADQQALRDAEARIQILTQRLSGATNAAIDEAQRAVVNQPDYAVTLLKDVLETIRDSADVSPEVRDELERRVIAAIGSVEIRREKALIEQRQQAQAEAILESQRKLLTQTTLREEQLKTRIEQVRGLLDRARHGDSEAYDDAVDVARDALLDEPGNGPATQALVMSVAGGYLDKAYRIVRLRQDRFLATLYQVELSHVPFPDEPPVLYPPADVWRALTLTRKKKYESFDLRSEKPAETWLRNLLDEPCPPLDFPGDVPISEILQQIADYYTNTYGSAGGGAGADYRMTIIPDYQELELDGVSSLEDVTVRDISLSGITLKNALSLIFGQTTDPELTYMIKNEVMLITTLTAAESDENLITRVYPLGDLAIPPNLHLQLGGGGIGGGGGLGGGGQGGFGGGGGQGGFGGGGGQGGFGGGGGGLGLGSVPPEALKPQQGAAGGINLSGKKKQ